MNYAITFAGMTGAVVFRAVDGNDNVFEYEVSMATAHRWHRELTASIAAAEAPRGSLDAFIVTMQ